MSKKRILNISSTKKRDNLGYLDPTNVSSSERVITSNSSTTVSIYLFSPTARQYENTDDPTDRSRQTVFWRGIREIGNFTSNSAVPWEWRRIVFEAKGLRVEAAHGLTSNGYRRVTAPYGDADTLNLLFEGSGTLDRSRFMHGKVDNSRVKVHYDKKIILRSGNDGIHYHQYKHYFPLNSNMYYADDESGDSMVSSNWCSDTRKGMGNIFILDMFRCVASTSQELAWSPSSTLYWHEK